MQSISQIELSADKTMLAAGDPVLLSVSTTISVSGTPWAVEMFDQTTGAQVGACAQASTCQVAFAAGAGAHTFIAYLAVPSSTIPADGIRLQSKTLNVQWLGVRLAASNPSVVGPGNAVTFTATASDEVRKIGYQTELFDTTTGQRLTYCSQGTTCSTSLIQSGPGTHTVVANLILVPQTFGIQPVQEQSTSVSATWLSLNLTASAYSLQGGTTVVTANANSDLTNTPWAIFIYRSPGQLIGSPCVAATCTASVVLPAAGTPSFFAVVARKNSVSQGSGSLLSVFGQVQTGLAASDIQARSAIVTPVRMMWGVDSCAAFTQDAAGTTGLLPQVSSMLGTPDFWARYLPTTGNCPALSTLEVAAARSHHMGILPIYNDYDCSAVSGNAAGAAYAASAVQIAVADLIPLGTGIAIDIEPPGNCPGAANVDVGFITGWYDVITGAGYAPIYYANSTPGSAFGQAWCATVGQRPEIAASSFLWSFEPDLQGGFAKSTAPAYAPYDSGCSGQYDAWQYRISDGSTPDVDHDEATSQLPIWYP
ncbi:MAG: glycoside hydrolase domain-containing protein [Candidatus Dormibacteraceae bacterium]